MQEVMITRAGIGPIGSGLDASRDALVRSRGFTAIPRGVIPASNRQRAAVPDDFLDLHTASSEFLANADHFDL
jgi:hypothetical protein